MGRPTSRASGIQDKQASLPAARISSEMTSQEISSGEMAKYLGVTLQAVNQYRQGLSNPTYPNLIKIAERLGVTTDYLLGAEDCKAHANVDINKRLGLSEKAIGMLEAYYALEDWSGLSAIPSLVSALLETYEGQRLIKQINTYAFADFSKMYSGNEAFTPESEEMSKVFVNAGKATMFKHAAITIQGEELSDALLVPVPQMLKDLRKVVQRGKYGAPDDPAPQRWKQNRPEADPHVNPEDSE